MWISLYSGKCFVLFMIVKLSASGKQFQVVDDSGKVYVFPTAAIVKFLESGSGFRVLTLMPYRVGIDRFPSSPVWSPDLGRAVVGGLVEGVVVGRGDAFDVKRIKSDRVKRVFADEVKL